MARITYTALRNIDKSGYFKTAADISAAASDHSFNSVGTDLSGIPGNGWFVVAGFSNAANNGWFEATGDSTPTKIAQHTSVAIVTEAVGKTIAITGFKRGMNQVYDVDFSADAAERSSQFVRTKNQAIGGGSPEVLLDRQDDSITVSVYGFLPGGPIDDTGIKQWREILSSVSAGEIFTLDCYGTRAAPVEPLNVTLSSDGWKQERIGGGRYYKLTFDVLVLA